MGLLKHKSVPSKYPSDDLAMLHLLFYKLSSELWHVVSQISKQTRSHIVVGQFNQRLLPEERNVIK